MKLGVASIQCNTAAMGDHMKIVFPRSKWKRLKSALDSLISGIYICYSYMGIKVPTSRYFSNMVTHNNETLIFCPDLKLYYLYFICCTK